MAKNNIEDIYPLSPTQQGLLFHTLYEPNVGMYFGQVSCRLRGPLDLDAFHQAWQQVVDSYPVLRTFCVWERREKPLQIVREQVKISWEVHDWQQLGTEVQQQLDTFLHDDRVRGFNLTQAPLTRVTVIRLGKDAYEVVWSHHVLIMDGLSIPIVLQDVFARYEALCRRQPLPVKPTSPYRDYILWLQKQDLQEAEAFWRATLQGFYAPTAIPNDGPTHLTGHERHAMASIIVTPELTGTLQSFARQNRLTMNTLIQGAWALLLSRYSGADDIVFGTNVSGRSAGIPGIERMVGTFMNTLPVRVQVADNTPLLPWLTKLQEQQAEMRQYESIPLSNVQRWSEIPRGTPLFESLLIFKNYSPEHVLQGWRSQITIERMHMFDRTNYPLCLSTQLGSRLELWLGYDQARIAHETAKRMLGHLQTLLAAIPASSNQTLGDLPMLTADERRRLTEWNATARDYQLDYLLPARIADQAARTPDAIAVVFDQPRTTYQEPERAKRGMQSAECQTQYLTYRELLARANQLAHHLRQLGVDQNALVGICMDRCLDLVVALVGVLQTGAAYLPLDPSYPDERLAFMCADARPQAMLTHSQLLADWMHGPLVCLDRDWPAIAVQPVTAPALQLSPDHLAYLIYTSGSTGRPKGVAIPHRALANFLAAMQEQPGLPADGCLLAVTTIAFDIAGLELFLPLISGARLVLASRAVAGDGQALAAAVRQYGITHLQATPATWRLLLAAGWQDARGLTMLCGGEALPRELAQQLCAAGGTLWNMYGPTETTIWSLMARVADPTTDVVPIGWPIANTQAYILDRRGARVPIGVTGELYIGGMQLAQGYLGRPELTAERFVPDPFMQGRLEIRDWRLGGAQSPISNLQSPISDRLYRTGDLARYRMDGSIEFLGRADTQVKLRGFRIELGEIETSLRRHPQVHDAVVLLQRGGPSEGRLIGYIVPVTEDRGLKIEDSSVAAQEKLSSILYPLSSIPGELREFLGRQLPEYMIPSAYVLIDTFPLLSNGKLDRAALLAIEADELRPDMPFVAPNTSTERQLADIWRRVLQVEQVGIHDSFFTLGGDSLLATQAIARIRADFAVDLPFPALFEHPTLAGVADLIATYQQRLHDPTPLIPRAVDGSTIVPATFAQERMWFLHHLEAGNPAYTLFAAFEVEGMLDQEAFEQSFRMLAQRHESLRTSFRMSDGQLMQVIHPLPEVGLLVSDLPEHTDETRSELIHSMLIDAIHQPFDLGRGPLLRVYLFRRDDSHHVLLVTMHHIISDGWSVGVMIRDLAALYDSQRAHEPVHLPELTVQYADYAVFQRAQLQGPRLAALLAYWKGKLGDDLPVLELPSDRPRPSVQSFRGALLHMVLPQELMASLTSLGRSEGATLFMVLLAAFDVLLARYTGSHDIAVGAPIANRTRPDVEDLIGLFVNTLVLRSNLDGNPTFREFLQHVRTVCLEASAHQDLPFERLIAELQPARSLSYTPLFQVMLVLQNMPIVPAALADLSLQPLSIDGGTAKFDLTLSLREAPDGLHGTFEYNVDLFDRATIARFAEHFHILLEGIAADPSRPIAQLPVISTAERQQLLYAWNDTASAAPAYECLHRAVEAQAARNPTAIAVICNDEHITYRELNERANQLAWHLQELGVRLETPVAICLDRSIELMIGLLGILKAGGAYVPLDLTYPVERLRYMLGDAQVSLLLTSMEIGDWRLESDAAQQSPISNLQSPTVVHLDTDWPRIAQQPITPPPIDQTAKNLSYIIYTSGSTGQPKGVAIEHGSLANLLYTVQEQLALDAHDVFLSITTPVFDIAAVELFLPILIGGQVVVAEREAAADGARLAKLLADTGVTVVQATPATWRQLLAVGWRGDKGLTLICTGEALPEDLAHALLPRGAVLWNMYGPTETTIWSTASRVTTGAPITIGRPIANTQVYILDTRLRPVPVGVPGELYIGGAGLARGYLRRPELTAEHFVPNPFAEERLEIGDWRLSGVESPISNLQSPIFSRLYRTGDLARYRADGQIEFLGRRDNQVKIRGFRIELGEIESVLSRHPQVREAVVVTHEMATRDTRLVAYVVAGDWRLEIGDSALDNLQSPISNLPQALRAFLKQRLPEYMVPSAFVLLDALPLTPNGKLNRRSLPVPDKERIATAAPFVPPRTADEERIAQIWREILGIPRIGIHDNFFDLGGHSLLATQVIARIRDLFRVEPELRAMMETPTVAGLAVAISQVQASHMEEATLAHLLEELSSLSDAEAQALLADAEVAQEGPTS